MPAKSGPGKIRQSCGIPVGDHFVCAMEGRPGVVSEAGHTDDAMRVNKVRGTVSKHALRWAIPLFDTPSEN